MKVLPPTVLIILFMWPLRPDHGIRALNQMIVWNVGQGLWITAFDTDSCSHFDSGGEAYPQSLLLKTCYQLKNYHYLSHLDWDHISHLGQLKRKSPALCRIGSPEEPNREKRQNKYERILVCDKPPSSVQEISFSSRSQKPNDRSRVFKYKNWALMTGDSTKSAEKIWANSQLENIKVLILGHHGSQTSTSSHLLSFIPKLKLAVVSARQKKYGHPHSSVMSRLKKYGVPVLKTEDWGHIIIETPDQR